MACPFQGISDGNDSLASRSEVPTESTDSDGGSTSIATFAGRNSQGHGPADPVSPASFGMASQGLRAASYDTSFCVASAAAFVFPPCLWLTCVWRKMDVYTATFTYGFRLAMVAWPMLWLALLLRRHLPDDHRDKRLPRAEFLFPVFCYVLVALVFVAFYGVRQADCPLARRRRGGSWREQARQEKVKRSGQIMDGTWRLDDWESFRLFVLPPPDRCPIVLKRIVCSGGEAINSARDKGISEYRERIRSGFISYWMKYALLLASIQPSVFPVWRWSQGMPAFGQSWTEVAIISLAGVSSYIVLAYLWFMALESLSVLRMQFTCIRNFTFLTGETCEQSIFDFSQPQEISRWLRLRALLQEYNHARLVRITGTVSVFALSVLYSAISTLNSFITGRQPSDGVLWRMMVDMIMTGGYVVAILVVGSGQTKFLCQHASLLRIKRLELGLPFGRNGFDTEAREHARAMLEEVADVLERRPVTPRLLGITMSRNFLKVMAAVATLSVFALSQQLGIS